MRWSFFSASPGQVIAPAARRLLSRRLRRRRRTSPWWGPFHFLAFLAAAAVAHATSVVPPTFPQLVSEAQVIARGTVTSVSSRWIDGPKGRVIETFVGFTVEKALKGNPGPTMTLQFLGGTVGQDSLRVAGMPQFKVGQHEILFVTGNGTQFCPLVRFGHGRYRIRTDAATHRRYMTRNDGAPLNSVNDVQAPERGVHAMTAPQTAMTPDDFEAQIATEVARHAR